MELLETDLRDLGQVHAPEGFAERVLAAVGIAPQISDTYAEVETSLGVVHVAWNSEGISAVRPAGTRSEFERWFTGRLGRPVARAEAPPERLARQVSGAIAGLDRRMRFDLSRLGPFEQDVLRKTAEIPRGEVRSYAWVAREIGRPRAVRAVGSALGNNPIPYLIPCHRVVRSDGTLGEYSSGGTPAKRAILQREGVDAGWLEMLAGSGARFIGSRTTQVFCVPTCSYARRVKAPNRVFLRDERDARGAGYRPCARCRPVAS
ncbi:MAG TPA: methylated-DNA--[protein]-cysteine S-methyltransferase [Candidatus Dormibacteraeota bacterium]|nr:methylated-DNA--[protein]-cysteine S-methyltransferase [Candidatus Dormibacteraeota bacterium]